MFIELPGRQIGRLVGQIAADLLLLMCDHAEALLTHYPDVPVRIIQVSSSDYSRDGYVCLMFSLTIQVLDVCFDVGP